jgi:hypothetical protein
MSNENPSQLPPFDDRPSHSKVIFPNGIEELNVVEFVRKVGMTEPSVAS